LSNPTINIGQIFGGTGASTVAGECILRFDVEFFPRDYREDGTEYIVNKNDIKKEVEDCIAFACAGDPWLVKKPAFVTWYQDTPAFQTDSSHPFVEAALLACGKYVKHAKLSGFPAGCDGVHLALLGKMPVVILGPGNVKHAHTINESLDIKQYLLSIKIIANLILNWVGFNK
jgi:acetylornithine deacetylase